MSSRYMAGTTVSLILRFEDANGNLVDPTAVSAYVLGPSGTVEDYVYLTDAELTRSAVGIYKLAYPLAIGAAAGTYTYGGRGTGTYEATAATEFEVVDWPFA